MGKIAKEQKKRKVINKLTRKAKDEIRLRFIVAGETLKDLAEEYGVAYSYLRCVSSQESCALLSQENEDEELKKMYNEALVSKSYKMLEVYEKIMEKAVAMLDVPVKPKTHVKNIKLSEDLYNRQKLLTSKDLINITNVIKIVEQRQFVLLMIREDKENG